MIEFQPERPAMTCTPTLNEETGEYGEPIVGIGHDPNSPFAMDSSPQELNVPSEMTEENDHYTQGDNLMIDSIMEAYPVENILNYIVENYPEDYYADYDNAIDNGDWDYVQQFLERMQAEAQEAGYIQETVTDEMVNNELNSLQETQPNGMETAYSLMQQADSASSDIERDYFYFSAQFHAGELSAADGINAMLNKYSGPELMAVHSKYRLT